MRNRHGILLRLSALLAAAYATLAGFHTLSDFDVWWQLASGRWMWDHGTVLRQETFSYTAAGAPWTYPVGGEILFYWIYRQGGLALLSLLTPLACLGVSLLLIRRGGMSRAWGVAIAAPLVAWRANVRADMFTTVLAAVFLAVLWENHRGKKAERRWLWILPPLMAIWVNLHPGFLLGLALMAFFTLCNPRRLMPCTALAFLATLANPFGWRVYSWLGSLASLLPLPHTFLSWLGSGSAPAYSAFSGGHIGELSRTPISLPILAGAFRWRDPDSALWWVMALALVAIAVGLFRGQGWGPLLLICSVAAALTTSRFQAVFAIATVILAPDLIAGQSKALDGPGAPPEHDGASKAKSPGGLTGWWAPVGALLLLAFVAVRITDLASNRYYVTHGEIASFGAGVSGWFPERAAKFVRENHLPRELYNDYNSGGYLTWSMAPEYPVFIDGRGGPYGSEEFLLQERLGFQGPSSDDWRAAIAKWKIHSLLISVSRFGGYGGLPIKTFCDSTEFRLAYLDETAAVFVGADSLPNSKANSKESPALDCRSAALTAPAPSASAWDRYQFYANAGKLYYALERDAEAEQAWQQAAAIFPDDPSLHLDIGQLRHVQGRLSDAEREFRLAIELRPAPVTWYALGDLLSQQGRPFEAMECFRQSALRDARPHEAWAAMGRSALAAQRPLEALDAANRALETHPYVGPAAAGGRSFVARTLAIRGTALLALHQAPAAIDSLEAAVHTAVEPRLSAGLRLALAGAYRQAGRLDDARRALEEAKKLGASGPNVDAFEKELEPVKPK
jgi:tetratricopeptide (TPR) repeat protein